MKIVWQKVDKDISEAAKIKIESAVRTMLTIYYQAQVDALKDMRRGK